MSQVEVKVVYEKFPALQTYGLARMTPLRKRYVNDPYNDPYGERDQVVPPS